MMTPRPNSSLRRAIFTGSSLLALALASPAHAGPTGGTVTAGSAAIEGDGTGNVTVTQASQRAIVDWRSFSIGAGETASFIQPDASSVTVNRVTGVDPSTILGSLSANGQVVLINRNGIAFGKGATVDVGGLVATTADIDRNAFMATGALNFSGGSTVPGASVVNEGRITVRDAGLAALVAPRVRNSGVITANLGRVALGSGTGFSIDFFGDGLVSFAPEGIVAATIGDGTAALVENDGLIEASGGQVLLSAAAAREVVNASVNVSGVIRADSISRNGGTITLGGPGRVTVDGALSADSMEGAGGRIDITGSVVTVNGGVSASGESRGGLVRIGGAFQGGKAPNISSPYNDSFLGRWGTLPMLTSAGDILIGGTASIDVSSTRGDGGTAVIWSDNHTGFLGAINATGARGGSVEISSARDLLNANLSGVEIGKGGFLLLDPKNITINGTGVAPDGSNDEYADQPGANVDISATELASQLSSGANVILQANNNITVSSAITVDNTGGDGGDLTLQAGNSILVNASITTDNGNLTLIANDLASNGVVASERIAGAAAITMAASTQISAGSGSVVMNMRAGTGAGGNIALRNITAGSVDISTADVNGDIRFNGNITTAGAQSYSAGQDIVFESGSNATLSASGEVPVTLTAKRQISLSTGSRIENTNTTATSKFDAIILEANPNSDSPAITGNFGYAIRADQTTITSAGFGNISLLGRGSTSSSNADKMRLGINLSGSRIESSSGDISVTGYGGGGAADIAIPGIRLDLGASIQTVDGDIDIKAYGSAGATAWVIDAGALQMSPGVVEATGTGNISILASGDGNAMHGVNMINANSRIKTASGTLSITGSGGDGPSIAHGVNLVAGSVSAGGQLTLDGIGGAQGGHGIYVRAAVSAINGAGISMDGQAIGSASNNSGIYIASTGSITSASGDIALTATSSGSGGNLPALYVNGGATAAIHATAGGNVTLQGTRTVGIGEGVWIGAAGGKVLASTGNIQITGSTTSNLYDGVRIGASG